ncbi:MAG: LLM class flavin-dependent oxidoreductase [Gulosibacter sp.]|uniref:LLM class flavin-dependent oxidoreductase n=1 Tax=Gulosibacter sp. TaxID=2817531 RepID=UPI003F8EB2D9
MSAQDDVKFVGTLSTADGWNGVDVAEIDVKRTIASAQIMEASGFDQTIIIYSSYSLDPFTVATTIGQHTDRLGSIIALRPNALAPTMAARAYGTVDQINGGRTQVHLIAGGLDSDQQREGDFATKDERYRRMTEYAQFLRRSWGEDASFDFEGEFYTIRDYTPRIKPHAGAPLPISVGGSSAAAFQAGVAAADIFSTFTEPLAESRAEIAKLRALEAKADRDAPLGLMLDSRVITAPTDELAWAEAHRIQERLAAWASRNRAASEVKAHSGKQGAESTHRILNIAEREELHDGVLWTKLAQTTGAIGSSAVLVGSYERVAEALAAYYDLGYTTFSLRGYGDWNAVNIELGQYVLPRVRELVAARKVSQAVA